MISDLAKSDTKEELIKRFNEVRAYTVQQCRPLIIEDYIPQPVEYISPPKWHLGHTTWFFEEFILKTYYKDYQIFDSDFSFLFNSYYNAVGDRVLRADRGNMTRPSVERVYAYREYVDEHLNILLTDELNMNFSLIDLGLHHEQQHQELLFTDLKFILGHNPLFPVYKSGFDLTGQHNKQNGYLKIQEGNYQIGYSGGNFCYDNELSNHTVFLHEFEICKDLVTNGELIKFINDGGYQNFDLWLDEGWAWVNEHQVTSPKYWHLIDGCWHQYTLAGLKKVQLDEILCHISYYEAAAFAEWKQMRLPTEYEWEVASDQLDWGLRWEWTASAYLPYPGFSKPAGAVGEYNGKFMVNQMVLRGASSATSPNHSRKSYRNFFHPHYQWQFTGIRLAKKQTI